MVNVRALARLVSLEVPERRPHGLYSFEQLLVATDVRHCVVESSAVEVREVFDVRGASDEQPLTGVLRMNLLQYGLAQRVAHLPLLDSLAHLGEPLAAVRGVVHELLVVHHLVDRVFEIVLPDEPVVVVNWDAEAVRHCDAGEARARDFTEVRGLRAEGVRHHGALLREVEESFFFEVEARSHPVLQDGEPLLVLVKLLEVCAPDGVVVGQRLEGDPPAVVLLEKLLRVLDVRVRHAPAFDEKVYVRERRRGLRDDDPGDGRQAQRNFVEDEYLVEAYLYVVVQLLDDVYAAQTLRHVQRLIFLFARDVALQDARESLNRRRVLVLLRRVGLEGYRIEESFLQYVRRQLYLVCRYLVALPELEGVAPDGRLPRERAEDEAAVRVDVVVAPELLAAFEREVRAVDEVLVEAVALRVDVIDFVAVLSVNDEEDVRQRVGLVCVDARELVEFSARAYRGERARRFHRSRSFS